MPKAYLIGGPPRIGKSHLALRVVRKRPMYCVSADSVRDMLQRALNPADVPALFELRNISRQEPALAKILDRHPTKAIALQNDESEVVWPLLNELIKSHLADGQDILVEGVEILPKNLIQENYAYSAVFLGNSSGRHAKEIALQAHKNPHDWLRRYSDGTIEDFAELIRRFSRYIEHEAVIHGLPYVETHDANFEASMASAEQVLLA